MALEVKVRINISNIISPEELSEIAENVKFLAEQPLLEVFQQFRNKEIDYSKGYRLISVSRKLSDSQYAPSGFFEYWVFDHAHVISGEGIPKNTTVVGMEIYSTKKEVFELERRRKIKILS